MSIIRFYDASGFEWRWNGRRCFMVKSEIEELEAGRDHELNGYFFDNLEEAMNEMQDYMIKDDYHPFGDL